MKHLISPAAESKISIGGELFDIFTHNQRLFFLNYLISVLSGHLFESGFIKLFVYFADNSMFNLAIVKLSVFEPAMSALILCRVSDEKEDIEDLRVWL